MVCVCLRLVSPILQFVDLKSDSSSLLSLELGRPALTKEEDCNVGMPSPIDDRYMISGIPWASSPTPEQSTSPLLPMIQVIGGIARLLRILKSDRLAKSVLQAYDSHFNQCVNAFPAQHQRRANGYIDPTDLTPMIYLQNARLMLHRHNLTPTCDSVERSAAIDHCVLVAKDTAGFLRRCMQPPREPRSYDAEQNDSWETRMVSASSAFFCTHVWRCTLFLCFRLDFENAFSCARASATLGNVRPVNVDCGRYLKFFLHEVISKLDQGAQLDMDEEMIAYVSGDLQGSFENSWIWQENKGGVHLRKPLKNSGEKDKQDLESQSLSPAMPPTKESEWDGWENVLRTIESLWRKKEQHLALQESSLRPPMMLPRLAPSPNFMSSSNRMSIKDLI